MSARAKSPGRIVCDNAAQATSLMTGMRKILNILTMMLGSLLIHGDDYVTVFADCLTSLTGDHLLRLSTEELRELYTGSRTLSREIGQLCLKQIQLMENLWVSIGEGNMAQMKKSFEDTLVKWLAQPELKTFVSIDIATVTFFVDTVLHCNSWTHPAGKLLGEPKTTVPLAMVQHLYGGTPADTDAGDQSKRVNNVGACVDWIQNWVNDTEKGQARDADVCARTDSDDKKEQDSPWHVTSTFISSWVWYILMWTPSMYMYFETYRNMAAHAEQNFFEQCTFVFTADFEETVQNYLSLMPMGIAWICILWRKFMNARAPPEERVSCTAPKVLLFFGAFQNIVHVIPIIRCGVMTTDQTLKLLHVPTWIYLLVMMYCAEIVYYLLMRSRVQRDVTKTIQALYVPMYSVVVAFYTATTYLDRQLNNPPFLRFIIVVSSVAMGADPRVFAQQKDKHWNCQWTSCVLSHAVCLLLVSYELGLYTLPDSVHPVLWERVTDAVGNTHLELYLHLFVYTFMNSCLAR